VAVAGFAILGATTARDRVDGLVMVEQSCRYLKPAVVGDTIKPLFVLEDIFQEGKRIHFRFKVRLLNQREEILLEGYHVYRLLRGEKRVRNP
jgi:acyl-CoA thioesterase FadM